MSLSLVRSGDMQALLSAFAAAAGTPVPALRKRHGLPEVCVFAKALLF